MNIYMNEDVPVSHELMELLKEAARLCLEGEELDSDKAEISLSFVGPKEIKELNGQYRGVDKVTDVLSFPMYEDPEDIDDAAPYLLGDVVICMDKVESQAQEFGHSRERETVYLFTHSMLHLLGYDHIDDEDRRVMRSAEEKVMEEMEIRR